MAKTQEQKKVELTDYMIETGICTEQEAILVANINGDTLKAMKDILYCRTQYRSLKQIKEAE